MHELTIIQNIFPIIEKTAQENQLKAVNKVVLKVGVLRQVVLEFLQFAFKTVAKDTVASGAELAIEIIPVTAYCKTCHKQLTVNENIYLCPYCEGVDLDILTGNEIILENIEGVN